MSFLSGIKKFFKPKVEITSTGSGMNNSDRHISTRFINANPVADWPMRDCIASAVFFATLQLRVPLRILEKDGEEYFGEGLPPRYAENVDLGIWVAKPKTFAELGLPFDDFSPSTRASDIGQVPADGGEYLKFLLAVRRIVENAESISVRIGRLRQLLCDSRWSVFVEKLGGEKTIVDRFFPDFVSTLGGLSSVSKQELRNLGLVTPKLILTASQDVLLSIKGVGKTKVVGILDQCLIAEDVNSEYAERVEK